MSAQTSIDTVRSLHSMQRRVVEARAREIVPVGAEMSNRQPIRGHVHRVSADSHRRGKVGLLPARSGLPCKCYRREKSASGAPEAAYMGAGVGRALVKANAGYGAADIRLERDAQLQRAAGAVINRRRHGGARPDGLLGSCIAATRQANKRPNSAAPACLSNPE